MKGCPKCGADVDPGPSYDTWFACGSRILDDGMPPRLGELDDDGFIQSMQCAYSEGRRRGHHEAVLAVRELVAELALETRVARYLGRLPWRLARLRRKEA